MTKHASLYESPKLHPFSGKFRTIEEIAHICGIAAAAVDRLISRGESMPMTAARAKWAREEETPWKSKYNSPMACTPAAQVRRAQAGRPSALTITIDGVAFAGLRAAGVATGRSTSAMGKIVARKGATLTAADVELKPKGKTRALAVTVGGTRYQTICDAALAVGVHKNTMNDRVKQFGRTMTAEQAKRKTPKECGAMRGVKLTACKFSRGS